MKTCNGFRFGNLYGSYSVDERVSCIGMEIGFFNVPNMDGDVRADTISIIFKLSHFLFAIGWIYRVNE